MSNMEKVDWVAFLNITADKLILEGQPNKASILKNVAIVIAAKDARIKELEEGLKPFAEAWLKSDFEISDRGIWGDMRHAFEVLNVKDGAG